MSYSQPVPVKCKVKLLLEQETESICLHILLSIEIKSSHFFKFFNSYSKSSRLKVFVSYTFNYLRQHNYVIECITQIPSVNSI